MKAGWEAKTLGDVYDVRDGTHDSPKYHATGYPLITSKNLKEDGLSFEDVKYINERDYNKINERSLVHIGDVLLAMIGTIGNPTIVMAEPRFAIKNVALFKVPIGQSSAFLKHYLDSEWVISKMMKEAKGTTQKFVGLGYLRSFPINVPSLPEQQRIVGILDEAFDGIATAKANAERNLQNARALFESHLQSVFTQRGEGWVEKRLEDVCALFVDSAHRTPKYQEEGIPALRPRDVVNGNLSLADAARVSEEEYEIQTKRYKPNPGDIVYSRELSYGWAAILPQSPRVCLSQGMCIFRPVADLDIRFLLYVLNGPTGREQAQHAAVGAAHPHINLGDIKSYLIPMPKLEQQRQITKHFDALAAETQRLESIYQQKLAALDELKKSLLHQAFTGQL